jgi:hypothetical protein
MDPNRLPFSIRRLEQPERLELLYAIMGSIAEKGLAHEPDTALQTADKVVEHFEVMTSALDSGFIRSIDGLIEIDGYQLRIYQPEY